MSKSSEIQSVVRLYCSIVVFVSLLVDLRSADEWTERGAFLTTTTATHQLSTNVSLYVESSLDLCFFHPCFSLRASVSNTILCATCR